MVADTTLSPYTLDRVDEHHWLIHDQRESPQDASHLVACLHACDDDVEVIWLQLIPLPTHYDTADDALDDLSLWVSQQSSATAAPPRRTCPSSPSPP